MPATRARRHAAAAVRMPHVTSALGVGQSFSVRATAARGASQAEKRCRCAPSPSALPVAPWPPLVVPNTLFRLERDGTDAQGDHIVLDLSLDVLTTMPSADQAGVAAVFANSGILSFDVDVDPWGGVGLAIPATGAPFRVQ